MQQILTCKVDAAFISIVVVNTFTIYIYIFTSHRPIFYNFDVRTLCHNNILLMFVHYAITIMLGSNALDAME